MHTNTWSYAIAYKAIHLQSHFFLQVTTGRGRCCSNPHFSEMNEPQGSPGQLLPWSHGSELEPGVLEIPHSELLPPHQQALEGKYRSGIKKRIVYPALEDPAKRPLGEWKSCAAGQILAVATRWRRLLAAQGRAAPATALKLPWDPKAKGKALRQCVESRAEAKVTEVGVRVLPPPQAYRSKFRAFPGGWEWRVHALLPRISSNSSFGVGQGSFRIPGTLGARRSSSAKRKGFLGPKEKRANGPPGEKVYFSFKP